MHKINQGNYYIHYANVYEFIGLAHVKQQVGGWKEGGKGGYGLD